MRHAPLLIAFSSLLFWLSGCPTTNNTPTANAGPDQQATLGDTVTLNGSASADADGDTLTFQWRFTTRPDSSLSSLENAGTAQPTFVPDHPGIYTLSLTVLDTLSNSDPDSVTITVSTIIPDVTGVSQAEAESQLRAAGLTVGNVTHGASDSVAEGAVLSQSVAAGTSVSSATTVDLIISTGPPVDVQRSSTFNLREALNTPLTENVLRPNVAAADTTNNRIFITALLSPHVAIYDTAAGQLSGTLDSGFLLPGEKMPCVAPGGTALYIINKNTMTLARIDIATNTITATTATGTGFIDMVVNEANNTLYIARVESPGLLLLNATTLAETGNSTALDGVAGDLEFDAAGNRIFVLDTALVDRNGTLRIFDSTANAVTDTIRFDMPGSGDSSAQQVDYDSTNQRFFIRGDNGLGVYDIDGSNPRSLPTPSGFSLIDMTYDPTNDRLLVLGVSTAAVDTVVARGTRIFAFNPNSGQTTSPIDTMDLGDGNGSLALDPGTNTLLSPDSTTGTLWTMEAAPFPATVQPVELGLNIDQIALAGDDALFISSRFGNNRLLRLTPSDSTLSTFVSGRWPTPFRARETTTPTLVVLNAWDGTLQEFTTDTNPVGSTPIATGFPAGTTERLPDLALSPDNSSVAIAYPEFGQVRVVGIDSGNEIAVLDVPNAIMGDGLSSKGQLQVYFNQGTANLLYVFDREQSMLHRYDAADGYALLGSTDLSAGLANMPDAPETDWLFHDVEQDRLYVGPLQVDPITGESTGDTLPAGQVIRGLDAVRELYWVVSQTDSDTGFTVTIDTINRTDNTLGSTEYTFAGTHPIAPEFTFDTANRRFFVAYPATTGVEEYSY